MTLVARGGRLPLAVIFAALAGACSAEKEPTNEVPLGNECEDRGEPIELGMEKQSTGGLYDTVLGEASPLPPLVGENHWTVEIATSAGEPVIDDPDVVDMTVVINVNMADHNHNIRKRAVMTSPGVFEFPPLSVTMPGYWEFTISVAPAVAPDDSPDPNVHEDALFGVCVPSD